MRRRIGRVAASIVLACHVVHVSYATPVRVTDDAGRDVHLHAPAQRVVSLAPHLTELLFEIGAGARLVGTAAFSDYPHAARSIPRIGDARALDLEHVIRLRPDLILAWRSGNSVRSIARLRALGFTLFESEPRRLEEIATTIERLGVLLGASKNAAVHARELRERVAKLRTTAGSGPVVSVFYQVWDRPLITISGHHIVDDVLAGCGALNIFRDHATLVPRPSLEAVVVANPQAIVVAAGSIASVAADAPWHRWSAMRAVRNQNIYTVSADLMHRPTARILDAMGALCVHVNTARARP